MSVLARTLSGELIDLPVGAHATGKSFVSISVDVTSETWCKEEFQHWLRNDIQTRLVRGGVMRIEVWT